MARYYFHIRDGDALIEDFEGVELTSIAIAKEEAEQAAREILAEKVKKGEVIDGQRFEINDSWGNQMLTVPFKSVLRLK